MAKSLSRLTVVLVSSVVLIVGALAYTRLLDEHISKLMLTTIIDASMYKDSEIPKKPPKQIEIPLNCTAYSHTKACPIHEPIQEDDQDRSPTSTCPDYFRWIHEDLRPWAHTGITKEMVESAKKTANFKLVILKGKVYVETYRKAFQTRDVFTLWGILQLLRRYPGKVPDLELMFNCADKPAVFGIGPTDRAPPPLFKYCASDVSFDIVFPDWSFWGWPELNIKPWELLVGDLKEGNKRTTWMDREPYAYWKGNPAVSKTREDLMKCNVSDNQDWNARLYAQDWGREFKEGFRQSDLASQCTHRYKVYIEGSAWSVSEKYILACDSVTLLVETHYYDFFTRGLIPGLHYWPIKNDDKCRSIKFAVDWGNSNVKKAESIGKAAIDFIEEELKMDYVYDYMFHLLDNYSKLLRYTPTLSARAVELCVESMVCSATGAKEKFLMESLVNGPASTNPCTMPPPFDPPSLHAHLRRKEGSIQQVESWEQSYWVKQNVTP